MTLVLEVVTESLSLRREHVFPDFEKDARFNPTWWHSGSAKSPVSYCRFLDNGEEVGRAKILPGSRSYAGYTTWSCPPAGVTEIDLIEIRPDLRRSDKRYGRQAVEAIGRTYGQPVIAMSWTRHRIPSGARWDGPLTPIQMATATGSCSPPLDRAQRTVASPCHQHAASYRRLPGGGDSHR